MGKLGARRFIEQAQALFPESGMTLEWSVLEERVMRFDLEPSLIVLREYRAHCRYRKPVFDDLLKALSTAKYGTPHEKAASEVDRLRAMDRVTDSTIAQEQRVAERVHIPELIRLGNAEVRRRRDRLLAGMNQARRNIAGAPTWEQLTGMDEDSARMRCWRFWIVTEQSEAFEPEVANT